MPRRPHLALLRSWRIIDGVMNPPHRKRWYHVDYGGVVVGLLFGALSLTPSLLPRPIIVQGIIAGMSFAFGYAFGALLWFIGKRVVMWRPPELVRRYAWWYVLAAWVVGAIALAAATVEWQNDVREHVGAEPISGENWVSFAFAGLFTTLACLGIGRLIKFGATDSYARFHRYFSARREPQRARTLSLAGSSVVVMAGISTVSALIMAGGLT